jgi:lysine 6-dehydrogenase
VIRGGQIVEVESLTEIEALSFAAPFERMEAFQTSGGTSTLPDTFHNRLQELDYKTIRYPGHCQQFKLLVDLGLASSEEIELDGGATRVRPRSLLGESLVRHLPADEPDVVLIRLAFRGRADGREQRLRYDIIDYYDERTGLSAMMRTTAFPASVIAQMMARGETTKRGALPQELVVPPDKFVAALAARNINISEHP